ncbi:MAG: hypothetical protein K1X74_11085 [Pirellulales bacterium]|nr:hypothetical protein [Pirellulales bacterium]
MQTRNRLRWGMLVPAVSLIISAIVARDPSAAFIGLWLVVATVAWPLTAQSHVPHEMKTDRAVSDFDSDLGIDELRERLDSLSRLSDPLLRRLVTLKIANLRREVDELVAGRIVFRETETWRSAYAELLRSPDVTEYLSVAWVVNEAYWRDLPGEHSLRTNFEALDRGVSVERICILGWSLWPPELSVPLRDVLNWINDQHYRGIAISLVREIDLVAEPDLLRDFGIYGQRATGEQQLDRHARTVGFTLSFDPADVALARDRWRRLQLFAQKYQELMDHAGTPI